jgi:hypothetical protein
VRKLGDLDLSTKRKLGDFGWSTKRKLDNFANGKRSLIRGLMSCSKRFAT